MKLLSPAVARIKSVVILRMSVSGKKPLAHISSRLHSHSLLDRSSILNKFSVNLMSTQVHWRHYLK